MYKALKKSCVSLMEDRTYVSVKLLFVMCYIYDMESVRSADIEDEFDVSRSTADIWLNILGKYGHKDIEAMHVVEIDSPKVPRTYRLSKKGLRIVENLRRNAA